MNPATTHEIGAPILRRFTGWYLETPVHGKSLILWWESRRLAYNLILLVWGVVNVPVGARVVALKAHASDSWKEVFGFCGLVLLLQVAANIWYTGGWFVGLIVRLCEHGGALGFNRYALLIGTLFSIVFVECWYLFAFKDMAKSRI